MSGSPFLAMWGEAADAAKVSNEAYVALSRKIAELGGDHMTTASILNAAVLLPLESAVKLLAVTTSMLMLKALGAEEQAVDEHKVAFEVLLKEALVHAKAHEAALKGSK